MIEHATLLFGFAVVFGFFMAWGVGANDVANAMAPSVGSGALSLKQAVLVAAIFEVAGCMLAGGQVTSTIRGGIIDSSAFANTPNILVLGMLASLLAAGTWLMIASFFGWPVSTTHSIVGALLGFGGVVLGVDHIHWHVVTSIALSWLVSPVLSGVIAFALFLSVRKLILNAEDPFRQAQRYVPFYVFLVSLVVCLVTFSKGLKHLHLPYSTQESVALSVMMSAILMGVGWFFIRRIRREGDESFRFASTQRIFNVLMVFTACAMAFAHGSNDVANAIGPLSAVVSILQHGSLHSQAPVPAWILALGAAGILVGLVTYGYRVIATIGTGITELTPTHGFAAGLATASTVVIASGTGLPVSTTQILVGAVLGVGLARGIGALNLSVVRNIFTSWVITLPAGALLAIAFYYGLSKVVV